MDAYEKLKIFQDVSLIEEKLFYHLIQEFQQEYLADIKYEERIVVHRNPGEVKQETLQDLNSIIIAIQHREEMSDIDKEKRIQSYVPTKVKEIWKADKRIRSLYQATEVYCKMRSKDFRIIAVHIAEYRAMNKLYDKITRSIYYKKKIRNSNKTAFETAAMNSLNPEFVEDQSSKPTNDKYPDSLASSVVPKNIFNSRPKSWQDLQNFVGRLFTEMGFDVEISKVIEHVRGKKEVDVFAIDRNSEYHPKVLIECKHWNTSVPQGIVHEFHSIVSNYGANHGFIVSKSGFQQGCYEAIKNTNINLVTLEDLEQKYYSKWQAGMINKCIDIGNDLFPYWDTTGSKMPKDGKPISFETQQLLDKAYHPYIYLDVRSLLIPGYSIYDYPVSFPALNDQLEIVGMIPIRNDRDLFDFMEQNKDKAMRHYKILYREI